MKLKELIIIYVNRPEPDYVDEILNFVDEKEIGRNILWANTDEKDELYGDGFGCYKIRRKSFNFIIYKENFKLDIIVLQELLI